MASDNINRSAVFDWLSPLLPVPAYRFRDCGESGRGWVGRCENGHEIVMPFSCEQRICPRCAGRRSGELAEKLVPALIESIESKPARYRLKHIVLGTDINILDFMQFYFCSPVGEWRLNPAPLYALRELVKLYRGFCADMFRFFARHKVVTGADGKYLLSETTGLLRFDKCALDADGKSVGALSLGCGIGVEFGFEGGLLHFHILAHMDWIDQRDLSNLWESYNLGHGRYCFMRALAHDPAAVSKGVGYVVKYVTKPLQKASQAHSQDVTPNVARMNAFVAQNGVESLLAALSYIFHGVRRFQTYGSFYDLDFPELETEVCSVCGCAFAWYSELDFITRVNDNDVLLKLLSANKFEWGRASPPIADTQMLLF